MKIVRERKGQFIIIAAMLISIMIISVSTVIYATVTYYRQERWEEYVTVVDSIRTSSSNLLLISLSNYGQTLNSTVFRDYLNQWIRDVRKAYPGYGVDMSSSYLAQGAYLAYGMNLNYNLGLARNWNQSVGFTAANATFNLDVDSVGLTGFTFSSSAFLKTNLRDAIWYSRSTEQKVVIYLSVDQDGPKPLLNLKKSNVPIVKLNGINQTFTMTSYYSRTYNYFIYLIQINWPGSIGPSNAQVTVQDARSVKAVSFTTTIQQNTGQFSPTP